MASALVSWLDACCEHPPTRSAFAATIPKHSLQQIEFFMACYDKLSLIASPVTGI